MAESKHEKLLREARERFDNAQEHEKDNRDAATEDFCFAAGDQWPEEVKRTRERDGRPCLTINRLPQFIRQVTGEARQNKPAIRTIPKDGAADPETAKIYDGIIRQIEAASRASHAYITALEHACTGGFGHWRVVTEYADSDAFEQDIRIRRIHNPFSVYWDSNATEYDRSDAMWCFVTEWISKEQFERQYPKETPKDWELTYGRENCQSWLRDKDDFVRIAEYWKKEPVQKRIGMTADGQVIDLTDRELPPGVQIVRQRMVDTHRVIRYVLAGHTVLEEAKEWPGKYIPIVPCYGPEEFYDGEIRYLSVIRYAKDPMRQYNYWQSSITEKIALAPKSPYIGTQKMFEGLEDTWARANDENYAYLPYNADPEAPGGAPQRNSPAPINQAELAQSAQAIDDLKATTGIYDASLGAQGNETSGRAIMARQQEGDTATFAWIDNLSRSIEHTGRILIDLIPRIYDTERMVRILGEDGSSEFVPINAYARDEDGNPVLVHDLAVGKYDVEVSVGPSFTTRRQEAAASITEFVRAYPASAPVLIPMIAKHMDWPESDKVAELMKKLAPPGLFEDENAAPPPPDPMQQMEMQKMQLELQKMQMDMQATMQKAESDTAWNMARADSERAQMHNRAVEAEGQELENAQMMLQMSMQNGQFQQLVEQEVGRILQQMQGVPPGY